MAFDPKIYRDNRSGIGMPADPKATDSSSDWTAISILKGIWDKLNTGITTTPAVGASTEAKQDAEAVLLGAVTEAAPATDTASSGLNGRLQRIAQRLTSWIALVPASLGGKAAAASFAVTTATDDPPLTLLGAVNETAPATDTASSGLNGRQQRIAQRLTSLIALFPASLGAKNAAGSFSVTTATDDNTLALLGAVTETAPATDTASSGLNGRLQRLAQRLAAGATNIAKAEDAASADADVGVPAMAVRKATPANSSGTDGDYEMLQMSAGRLWVSAILEAGTAALGTVSRTLKSTKQLTNANVSFSASGENTVVSGTASQTIRVFRGSFTAASPVTLTFKDAAGGTTLHTQPLGANACFAFDCALDEPMFVTATAGAFICSLSAAVAISGSVQYVKS